MRPTRRGVVAGVLVLLVALVCVRLGFWQLERLEQRRAHNALLRAALAEPVLELNAGTLAAVASDPAAYTFRTLRVYGSYRPDEDVILRGRSLEGQPGVHLLTPLAVDGTDVVVLVNRGWVPAADAATVDPRPLRRAGPQVVEGLLQPYPAAEGDGLPAPLEVDGHRVLSLRRLDATELRRHAAAPLLPFYVQELPAARTNGPPVALPLPRLDEGPHLGYALQWFGFATVFLVGYVVAVARKGRGARENVRH